MSNINWPTQLTVSVTSGVLVATILAVSRGYWKRQKAPLPIPRAIRRDHYLRSILSSSLKDDVKTLEILAPRLTRAGRSGGYVPQLQNAWKSIAKRGSAKVITRLTDSCLDGAVELANKGIEVRIARTLDAKTLTYHIFGKLNDYTTVLNDRSEDRDRPVQLDGHAPSRVFRQHFEDLWASSRPLESAISNQVIAEAGSGAEIDTICEHLLAQQKNLGILPDLLDSICTHLAFKHGCSIVFVVGLPGSGKSHIRRRVAYNLREMHIEVAELTDYVYAYRDYLHGSMKLGTDRGSGFEADEGGAFRVATEEHLRPALRSLAENVWTSAMKSEVTLVEFARADILASLREFGDDIFRRAHLIYVQAPQELREQRIHQRASPPLLEISGLSVSITVSDDHRLPSTVGKSLYGTDDLERLRRDRAWKGRFSYIENDSNDADFGKIDQQLEFFMRRVVEPYASRIPRDAH